MPSLSPSLLRRIGLVALVVGLVGLGAGAGTNQVVARFLALPEDEEPRTYTDKDAPEPTAAKVPVVGGAPSKGSDEAEPTSDGASEPEAETPEESGPRSSRALSAEKYAEIIVRRNIFDSTAVYQPPQAIGSGNGECVTDDSVRLLATMVADPPEYSTALVAEGSARAAKSRPVTVGESLGAQGKIAYIAQKRVCMEGGACLCMGEAGLAAKEKPAAGEDGAVASADGAVTKTGDNSYTVDRSFLEEQLGNVEALATQIRPRPHRGDNGEVDGYRLSSIKRGSVFDKLGVKNGDVIHAVNGQPMTSLETATSAYSGLSREKSFTFEITRRNQKITLDYSVR